MSENPSTEELPETIPMHTTLAMRELLRIETEVAAKYAARMAAAGFLRRMYLRAKMKGEVEDRLEKLATRLPVYLRKTAPAAYTASGDKVSTPGRGTGCG